MNFKTLFFLDQNPAKQVITGLLFIMFCLGLFSSVRLSGFSLLVPILIIPYYVVIILFVSGIHAIVMMLFRRYLLCNLVIIPFILIFGLVFLGFFKAGFYSINNKKFLNDFGRLATQYNQDNSLDRLNKADKVRAHAKIIYEASTEQQKKAAKILIEYQDNFISKSSEFLEFSSKTSNLEEFYYNSFSVENHDQIIKEMSETLELYNEMINNLEQDVARFRLNFAPYSEFIHHHSYFNTIEKNHQKLIEVLGSLSRSLTAIVEFSKLLDKNRSDWEVVDGVFQTENNLLIEKEAEIKESINKIYELYEAEL